MPGKRKDYSEFKEFLFLSKEFIKISWRKILSSPFLLFFLFLFIFLIGITLSFLMVNFLQSENSFCCLCHKHPYWRSYKITVSGYMVTDLALAHWENFISCIQCHRGDSLSSRWFIFFLSVKNTLKYAFNGMPENIQMKYPLKKERCLFCHQEKMVYKHTNIFHKPAHKKIKDIECVECHIFHENALPQGKFVIMDLVIIKCKSCHPEIY